MHQTRFDSFMEALVNLLIGFVLAVIAQTILYKAYEVPISTSHNFQMVGWMSLLSIGRSYILRRIFNGRSIWLTLKQKWKDNATCR